METLDLKQIHDQLLAARPAGIEHDAAACQLCQTGSGTGLVSPEIANKNNEIDTPRGGAMSDKTFTEDDVKDAVAKATADLASELAALKESQAVKDQEAEVAKAVETVKSEKDTEIAELQGKLDTAVLEAENAKKELADLVSLIENESARAEREAELAARRDERLAKVRAVASFPEEYLTANADRWSALDDEAFEALCADYAAVSNKETASDANGGLPPRETAMQGERTNDSRKNDRLSATKSVLGASLSRVNLTSL